MTHIAQDRKDGDFFQGLRDGFAFVAARADHVRINGARLNAYADALPSAPPANLLDSVHHFVAGAEEEIASYYLTLDSINFGSGYKPALAAEGCSLRNGSIYYTLSQGLKEKYERSGAYGASDLARIDTDDIRTLFGLHAAAGGASQAFAEACARALNETGRFVADECGGSFMELIGRAGGSAASFVRGLTELRHFDDSHIYRGRSIAIHKRAQIAAADLQLAFRAAGRTLFSDIGGLTMFADNAVPHVLHTDGVLDYDTVLAADIRAGREIPSGSPAEIEIRACAAHAVELIARRKGMIAMDVDHILWHRSAEDSRYRQSPSHRTLSWFY